MALSIPLFSESSVELRLLSSPPPLSSFTSTHSLLSCPLNQARIESPLMRIAFESSSRERSLHRALPFSCLQNCSSEVQILFVTS
jgi:hypothetical protein